jgi:hypothetical protein
MKSADQLLMKVSLGGTCAIHRIGLIDEFLSFGVRGFNF